MNSIGEIIATNRKKKKLTQPQLAEKLAEHGIQVSYKTISGWEKNVNEPGIITFAEICRILEVPDLYLALFGNNPFDMTTMLNEEGKAKVADYVSLLLASHKYARPQVEILPFAPRRSLKLYDVRVSAGTGNFLENASYEMMEVGPEVPMEADFGVQIAGDSMEPRYVNHQIVWVHAQEELSNGEIGVFIHNGDTFCKKLSNDENGLFLISLNKKYAPIPVRKEDQFKIFGKVLN